MIPIRLPCGGSSCRRLLVPLFAVLALLPAARDAWTSTRDLGFEYLSPTPGARLVSPWNNIVLRPGPPLDATSLAATALTVTGSRSGGHTGCLVVSDDSRTLVFTPDTPFAEGEHVTAALAPGLRAASGAIVTGVSFDFSVTANDPKRMPHFVADETTGKLVPLERLAARAAAPMAARPAAALDTVPAAIPTVSLMVSNQPDPGAVFISPFHPSVPGGNLMIVDNAAQVLFYRSLPDFGFDFKMQPNGLLTYFGERLAFWGLDSSYAVVDSFRAGNGYTADTHDLQLLPNGHSLLLSYDAQPVAMDEVVPGGLPDAIVVGLVVQELDQARNVVFQWRSWDHFQITDADTCLVDLRSSLVDYVHGNAVEMDTDGSLLISSRAMNEITKIDRSTGDVLWRLGRHAKHNQFTFVGDPGGFTGQHDIRRLPNGNVSLFDNANCPAQGASRGIEYQLDEVNKIATQVWEVRHSPDLYSLFMGNLQRRANGSSMVGWGGTQADPKVTDVRADGTVALALGFQSPNEWTYRAFRFPWKTTRFVLGVDSLDFGVVEISGSETLAVTIRNHSASPVTITSAIGGTAPFTAITALPLTLAPNATDSIRVRFAPIALGSFRDTLYVRSTHATEIIAQPLVVLGKCEANGVWIEDVTQFEGHSGTTAFHFRVRIVTPRPQDVSVRYTTANGSATVADSDYVAITGRATIKEGDTAATITIAVRGDHKIELDEWFFVNLTNPLQVTIDDAQARGTIADDDLLAGVDDALPVSFALHPTRPNPAHRESTIRYELPRASRVRLEVFDLNGRRVQSLVDGLIPAGRHEATWKPLGGATGVFFCRLRAGDFAATRKLVLVR